eukprot:TRINITY_DN14453_c0_g1_i1.p1 TRINITY_DN14453_c0_g1~~TRINITY_DN14453_c0_g1_i1.p1  ORF type:complete len:422 (+),score=70.78 TRINITY_DN14453_c0_g1_i1:23-1267(+)
MAVTDANSSLRHRQSAAALASTSNGKDEPNGHTPSQNGVSTSNAMLVPPDTPEAARAHHELLEFAASRTGGDDVSVQPLLRSSGRLTVTRLWSHEDWAKYCSMQGRWLDALQEWPHSTVVQRTALPTLLLLVFTTLVATVNRFLHPGGFISWRMALPMAPLTLSGGSLALLLVFRTNQAYDRLKEARQHWGNMVRVTREVQQLLVAHIDFEAGLAKSYNGDLTEDEVCSLVARYLAVLVWVLRARLTSPKAGLGNDEIAVEALLPEHEGKWLLATRLTAQPGAVLLRLRSLTVTLHRRGSLSDVATQRLEEHFTVLAQVSGACERLLSSPIGPTYTRHSLRALLLWLFALPVTLEAGGSVPLPQLLVSVAATAYIMLGIDEMANQVEQPFAVLPLKELCVASTRGVAESLRAMP